MCCIETVNHLFCAVQHQLASTYCHGEILRIFYSFGISGMLINHGSAIITSKGKKKREDIETLHIVHGGKQREKEECNSHNPVIACWEEKKTHFMLDTNDGWCK